MQASQNRGATDRSNLFLGNGQPCGRLFHFHVFVLEHQQPVVCTFLACEGLPGLHTLDHVCFDWYESTGRVQRVHQRSSDTGSVHTGVFTPNRTCNMHRSFSPQCGARMGRPEHVFTPLLMSRTLVELQRATNVS